MKPCPLLIAFTSPDLAAKLDKAIKYQLHPKLAKALRLLMCYPLWDDWKTHELCFLEPAEWQVLEAYIVAGTVSAMEPEGDQGIWAVQDQLNVLMDRLIEGHHEYLTLSGYLAAGGEFPAHKVEQLILKRPFAVFGFPTAATNALKRTGYLNFGEMHTTRGIARCLKDVRGLGKQGQAAIRMAFERYGLQALLNAPTIEYNPRYELLFST